MVDPSDDSQAPNKTSFGIVVGTKFPQTPADIPKLTS